MAEITPAEAAAIDSANASGCQPVVFVHGLWMLSSSWESWRKFFAEAGYATVAPNWPDDPDTAQQGNADPGRFAGKTVGQIARHLESTIDKLTMPPVVIGHSFGGLLVQILAGRGLAKATVAIDPAPFRGVLPLPISALRSAFPVLKNPANRYRAVALTYDEFRYGFANAVEPDEAKALHQRFAVPGSGRPLFQAATANFNPHTDCKVDSRNPARGPLLVISGEKDHIVPWSIANASYKRQKRNSAVTEIIEILGRGHSLVIDHGWREVADSALAFVQRFARA